MVWKFFYNYTVEYFFFTRKGELFERKSVSYGVFFYIFFQLCIYFISIDMTIYLHSFFGEFEYMELRKQVCAYQKLYSMND